MPPKPSVASDGQTDVTGLDPRGTALLLVLVAALLLLRLGTVPLLGPDEPRYARVAVEMHRSGNWVTPTLGGEPWLEKPILYYWLAGGAFSVLGENEWAARLPSVVAALLLVGGTALFGARLFGRSAGLHAGFIAGTSLLVFAFGRAATMDMLLASFTTLALGFFALGLLGIAGRLAVPVAWVCVGLATLAKGPIGVLLPVLVVGIYVAVTRRSDLARRALSPAGLALCALVAAPWYLLILRDQGRAFVDVFLLNHNVERFTSTVHHHPGPVVYYLPVLLLGLFPWSGLALPAFARLAPRRKAADLFVLAWLLAPLVFFSAAGSKLPGYVLPCVPPLALLMGRASSRLARGEDLPIWAGPRAVAIVGVALGTLVACGPLFLRRMGEPGWILLIPTAAWTLVLVLSVSRTIGANAAGALGLLRVGGAGLLALLAFGAPPVLARQQSGREVFRAARGREVLVWGAWRTAWMSGYFYDDGRVREVHDLAAVTAAARSGPTLVFAGPGERRRLQAVRGLTAKPLAADVRNDTLLEVSFGAP
jgi:4-amino-4-deoxy-L-arabinose transferase-like glycosyltransferase